jgi:hypothetical protein
MSIWAGAKDEFKGWQKSNYRHFPNPFRNAVKRVRQLACEETVQAKIAMVVAGFGFWWFSNFVPQPTEIVRKTATGSYKCGFFFAPELPSPLDLWPGPDATVAFAEMVRPFITPLFYIWATETLFSALDTWQSMVYAMDMCDIEKNETLLAEGVGDMHFQTGVGSPGFYDVLYDPLPRYSWPGGDIESHVTKVITMDAIGVILAGGAHVNNIQVYFARGSIEPLPGSSIWQSGSMSPGDVATWDIEYSGLQDPGTFQIVITWDQEHTGLAASHIFVSRWTSTFHQVSRPPCHRWRPGVLPA